MTGDNLKSLRQKKGYNMRQMATALGLPYTTYVNYEKGDREPNSEQLLLFAKYFDVTVDYLLGRTDNKETQEPDTNIIDINKLNDKQLDSIQKYCKLDNHGQKIADLVINEEYKRCQSENKPLLIRSFRAACSQDNHEPEIVEMEDLSKYPTTDEEF